MRCQCNKTQLKVIRDNAIGYAKLNAIDIRQGTNKKNHENKTSNKKGKKLTKCPRIHFFFFFFKESNYKENFAVKFS